MALSWLSPRFQETGSSSHCYNPCMFLHQWLWGLFHTLWIPRLWGLCHSPVVPPSLSAGKCGTTLSISGGLAMCPICLSCPSVLVDSCFFNSLVVRLPFSSIFWYFWLIFVFKLFVFFFWLLEEVKHMYPWLHLYHKPYYFFVLMHKEEAESTKDSIVHNNKQPSTSPQHLHKSTLIAHK